MPIRPSSLAKRRAILDAAERAFLSSGYSVVTVDAVAERAGVSKQTVYAHFGSKQALFIELVTSMTREAGDQLDDDPPHLDDAHDLAVYLTEKLRLQLDIVLTPRLLQLRRLVIGEVARLPELAQALAQHGPRRAIEALAVLLEDVASRGVLAVAEPRVAASQLNWLVMAEPLNDAMLLGDDAVPTPAELDRHVHRAVATFLAGQSGALRGDPGGMT